MEISNKEMYHEDKSKETNPPKKTKRNGLFPVEIDDNELKFRDLLDKARRLKEQGQKNKAELCKTIYQADQELDKNSDYNLDRLVKKLHLKKTQAFKYLAVGRFLSNINDVQSTEWFSKLGIEKYI